MVTAWTEGVTEMSKLQWGYTYIAEHLPAALFTKLSLKEVTILMMLMSPSWR